jgi:hypothetical protein
VKVPTFKCTTCYTVVLYRSEGRSVYLHACADVNSPLALKPYPTPLLTHTHTHIRACATPSLIQRFTPFNWSERTTLTIGHCVHLVLTYAGVRKEVEVDGTAVLLFWYRNAIYAIQARSPAEGAYSEGFIKAKFTQARACESRPRQCTCGDGAVQ